MAGGGFLAGILKWFGEMLFNKVWEQAQLEDTVEDADPVLETFEIDSTVDPDDGIDAEFDAWLSDSDENTVRPVNQAA